MEKVTINDRDSVLGSPFGGFTIGEAITDPLHAIRDYFEPEWDDENTNVKEVLTDLMRSMYGSGIDEDTIDKAGETKGTSSGRLYATEDTMVGGCSVINPMYQFGDDDDIVPPLNETFDGGGMGRVYSEMYMDNMHTLWLGFGVPRYNSLAKFYTTAYNRKLIDILTSGDTSLSNKLGNLVGAGAGLALALPVLPFVGLAKAFNALAGAAWGRDIYKFYELKPAMHNYYKTVNTILTTLSIHMNFHPHGKPPEDKPAEDAWTQYHEWLLEGQGNNALLGKKGTDKHEYEYDFTALTLHTVELCKAWEEYDSGLYPDLSGMTEGGKVTLPMDPYDVGSGTSPVPHVLNAGPDIVKLLSTRFKRRRHNFKEFQNTRDGEGVTQTHTIEIDSMEQYQKAIDEAVAVATKTGVKAMDSKAGIAAMKTITASTTKIRDAAAAFAESDDVKKAKEAGSDLLADVKGSDLVAKAEANAKVAKEMTEGAIDTLGSMFDKATGEYIGTIDISTDAIKETLAKSFSEVKDIAKDVAKKTSEAWKTLIESENVDKLLGTATGDYAHIGIRIEKGTSASESISNSTMESAVGQKMKQTASAAASRRHEMAGGNTGIGILDGVVSAVTSAANAAGSVLGLGALTDMITQGSGYIDIPKVWADSSYSKSYTFNIKLQSPYGDPISIYQSNYIPLAMLMAGAFPLGIGKNAYASPFIVQAYSQGMFSAPLAIISNMSIDRGASENGWTHDKLPTVIDVSLTIEDLSPMMYLSVTDKSLLEIFRANTTYQDYMATLAGVSLEDRSNTRQFMVKKAKIAASLWKSNTFNVGMAVHKIGSNQALRRAYAISTSKRRNFGRK